MQKMHWTHSVESGKVAPAQACRSAARRCNNDQSVEGEIHDSAAVRVLGTALFAALVTLGSVAHAQARKPNILVIWGDDIGGFNISAYNQGMMGYRTPNIDSIAR